MKKLTYQIAHGRRARVPKVLWMAYCAAVLLGVTLTGAMARGSTEAAGRWLGVPLFTATPAGASHVDTWNIFLAPIAITGTFDGLLACDGALQHRNGIDGPGHATIQLNCSFTGAVQDGSDAKPGTTGIRMEGRIPLNDFAPGFGHDPLFQEPMDLTWTILSGAGTAGLSGIQGHGAFFSESPVVPFFGSYTGEVTIES